MKDNKVTNWLAWCRELVKRKKEVMNTLRDEKTLSESCFISKDKKYVYYFMEVESFKHSNKAAKDSKHNIDKEHREKLSSCLEKEEEFRNLFHFENRT